MSTVSACKSQTSNHNGLGLCPLWPDACDLFADTVLKPRPLLLQQRKNDGNHLGGGGKKRSHTVTQGSEDIILLDPRPHRKLTVHIPAAVSAAAAAVRIDPEVSYVQPIQTITAYKRSFHTGGKQYLMFAGLNGLIKNIYIKALEWSERFESRDNPEHSKYHDGNGFWAADHQSARQNHLRS